MGLTKKNLNLATMSVAEVEKLYRARNVKHYSDTCKSKHSTRIDATYGLRAHDMRCAQAFIDGCLTR